MSSSHLPHVFSSVASFAASHKIATGVVTTLIAASLIMGGGIAVAQMVNPQAFMPQASVVRVVDGDTIEVSDHGQNKTIRLLNVNTPETVDPSKPIECGGPEASDYLKKLLPPGTPVRLGYDRDKRDRYGRDLAAVFLNGSLVDADIARNGWGVAIKIGENTRYYSQVFGAQREAHDKMTGLYDPSFACTPQQQAQAYAASQTPAAPGDTATANELTAFVNTIDIDVSSGAKLLTVLDGDHSSLPLALYTTAEIKSMRQSVEKHHSKSQSEQKEATDHITRLKEQEEQRQQQERQEAEQRQHEQEQELAQQQKEQTEAQAQGYSQGQNQQPANNSTENYGAAVPQQTIAPAQPAPNPQPSQSSGSGGRPSNAAPCRKYAPGGKSFVYIDCVTKMPL